MINDIKNNKCLAAHGSFEVNGYLEAQDEIIQQINKIYNSESVVLYNSGYIAGVSFLMEILEEEDSIFIDEECHQSAIEGCTGSQANIFFYKHNDANDLESKIKSNNSKNKYILSEGVFSMTGDICDLPGTKSVASKYDAILIIDEACSLGNIGKNGFGVQEFYNMQGSVDVIIGTFSKSIPGLGGYVSTKKSLAKKLRMKRSASYSTSLSLLNSKMISLSLNIMINDKTHIKKLSSNTVLWQKGLKKIGLDIGGGGSAIASLRLKHEQLRDYYEILLKNNIYTFPAFYPWNKKERETIRTSITAAHSVEHITSVLDIITRTI